MIETVLGPISADTFGFALPHEHILVDFIGASATGRHRWNIDEVVREMLPRLRAVQQQGVTGFVDCTPAYLGRDPRILKILAEETGLHILTNTGYYGGAGDKYVPQFAFRETSEQLAARWIIEWEQGIEDTDVKPGHIKIGVEEIPEGQTELSAIDATLVRAAAFASQSTGLSVTCHTEGGRGGLAATRLFIREGGKPNRFIVAHSDGHGHETNFKVAEAGSWVSYDGIAWQPIADCVCRILPMLENFSDRLLLSMDSGWYWVGEKNGGNIRDFSALPTLLLPALREVGVTEDVLHRLTVDNPARAFALS